MESYGVDVLIQIAEAWKLAPSPPDCSNVTLISSCLLSFISIIQVQGGFQNMGY